MKKKEKGSNNIDYEGFRDILAENKAKWSEEDKEFYNSFHHELINLIDQELKPNKSFFGKINIFIRKLSIKRLISNIDNFIRKLTIKHLTLKLELFSKTLSNSNFMRYADQYEVTNSENLTTLSYCKGLGLTWWA